MSPTVMPPIVDIPRSSHEFRNFRTGAGKARGDERWRPRIRIVAAWFAALVLSSGLAWAISWYRPHRPVNVVLVGAGYQENLTVPHNSYGWQSLTAFAHIGDGSGNTSSTFSVTSEPRPLQSDFRWQHALQDTAGETLLLFISAHGGADRTGAYLLPNDFDGQTSRRLRLDGLFDRLAELPADKRKLICFDVTQIASSWQLGILHNDFARALAAFHDRIESIPNLSVICASDIDQRSWVCEQWRRTVFSHYFLEGLDGGVTDIDRDGRIDVAEMHEWLETKISGWVAMHRGAAQTPMLLPLGEAGRDRARGIELAVSTKRNAQSPNNQPDTFASPRELHDAWQRYEKLLGESPPGFSFAPAFWREYVDTLLRYEELIRAGDKRHAARMHERLVGIEYRMQREKTRSTASMQNSLSIHAVTDVGQLPQQAAMKVLNTLWNAEDRQRSKIWQDASEANSERSDDRHLLRLALFQALLQRVIEDPAGNLDTATSIVKAVASPLYPLPSEIHLLAMLHQHLPQDALDDASGQQVSRALTLQRLAEKAAVAHKAGSARGAEQVLPWIESHVDEGDQQRRLAEDLLFADAKDRAKAETYFAKAEREYEQALELAQQVRSAIAVRDSLQAKLPYYTDWLTNATLDPYVADARRQDILQQGEELWRQAHLLIKMLEQPDSRWVLRSPPPTAENPSPRSLVDLRKSVKLGLDELIDQYHTLATSIATGDTPPHWHTVHSALKVPHHDWRSRLKLLARSRQMTRRMLEKHEDGDSGDMAEAVMQHDRAESRLADAHHRAMTTARWQGRMALATLGRQVFAQPLSGAEDTYEQLLHRLNVFEVEQNWWKSVIVAGDEIFARFANLPEQIEALLRESDSTDPDNLRAALVTADRLVRQIDGAEARQLTTKPAVLFRRLRMHDLMVFLAQRTIDGHWFDVDPSSEPYFRRAASAYLNDAQRLYPESEAVAKCRDRLTNSGGLRFDEIQPLHLMSQKRLVLDYQIQSTSDQILPTGFPVSWLTAGAGLELVEPVAGQRIVRRFDAQKQGGHVTFSIDCPPLDAAERKFPLEQSVQETELAVHGFFRGQLIQSHVPVTLHLRPEIVSHRYPLPDAAVVSLSTTDEVHHRLGTGTGTVALVLDCSGSMGPPEDVTDPFQSKYAEAVAALREVLSDIPRGTRVSLWTFGQALGPGRTAATAESTIFRVQDPIAWNPADPSQLTTLMEKIDPRHIRPWNESPIVRTILAAKGDVEDAPGFRTILVITDGMDNRFAKDRVANPRGKAISEALTEAFTNSGISLNVVGFKVVGSEESKAQQQFSVVERLSPPGRFYRVTETELLAETLNVALRRRLRFQVNAFDAQPTSESLELGYSSGGDVWPLRPFSPGVYQIRAGGEPPVNAEVALQRGDVLALTLAPGSHGMEIHRRPYATEHFPHRPFAESHDWRATLLQNQMGANGQFRGAVALERATDNRASFLSLAAPTAVWFEAYPEKELPRGLAWRRTLGFPLPVWSLSAADWPALPDASGLAPPKMRVWWSTDEMVPYAATLKRDAERSSIEDLRGAVMRAADETIYVESVSWEEHFVDTGNGRREAQPCLVVRLRHPPGQTYWAKPLGLETAGAEQRFYPSIGNYTGLFWPVTKEEANRHLHGIAIVSLQAFQRDAERLNHYLEFSDLPAPDPNDILPTPVYSFD